GASRCRSGVRMRLIFAAYQGFTPRLYQLAVVGELEELMEVVIHDPDVLLRIVRVDLDLVRTARAFLREDLVVLRPRLHHAAVAIDDDDAVLPVLILRAGGVARKRNAELRAGRQWNHSPLHNPHSVWRLREDTAG